MLEFALEAVTSKVDVNKAADKSLAIQKLLPLLYEIKDPIIQAQYVQKMARLLKLNESTLIAALRKTRATKDKQLIEANRPRFFHQLTSSPIEEHCLALLLQHPELRQTAQELSPEHFVCTENRELFTKWQQSQDISELKGKLDMNLLEHLNYLLNKSFPPAVQKDDRQHELIHCILRLQERYSRDLEAKKEAALNLEREEQGINAELVKLEEQGTDSSQRIREIFIKQSRLRR
jgi:DNA primase